MTPTPQITELVSSKIRIKKTEDGYVFAVKTQKLVSEEEAERIAQKKEETRIRRAERNKSKKMAQRGDAT